MTGTPWEVPEPSTMSSIPKVLPHRPTAVNACFRCDAGLFAAPAAAAARMPRLAVFARSGYFGRMSDPELVRVLDYVLNRCGAAEIEAVAAAVVRRKRDLTMFGEAGVMDPTRFAKKAARDLAGSAGASLASVRGTVRDLAAEMLRKEAPELSADQIDELLGAWVPDSEERGSPEDGRDGIVDVDGDAGPGRRAGKPASAPAMSSDVLLSMAEQFVAYSTGRMPRGEDEPLRRELGDWPARYWKAFPGGVRAVVTEYLKGGADKDAFMSKLRAAVEFSRS